MQIMGMGLNCIDPFDPAMPHIKVRCYLLRTTEWGVPWICPSCVSMHRIEGYGWPCKISIGVNCFPSITPTIHHSLTQGTLQTVVHLGCPPGLRVEFNPHLTTTGQRHYCTPTSHEDVCLYYEKGETRPQPHPPTGYKPAALG